MLCWITKINRLNFNPFPITIGHNSTSVAKICQIKVHPEISSIFHQEIITSVCAGRKFVTINRLNKENEKITGFSPRSSDNPVRILAWYSSSTYEYMQNVSIFSNAQSIFYQFSNPSRYTRCTNFDTGEEEGPAASMGAFVGTVEAGGEAFGEVPFYNCVGEEIHHRGNLLDLRKLEKILVKIGELIKKAVDCKINSINSTVYFRYSQ